MARDSQRSRVYAWERRVKDYHRPPTWRTIEEVVAWAEPVWRAERGRYGHASKALPLFRSASWGQRSAIAHYDHSISLPLWARQGPVVLHEMAHRLQLDGHAGHGPRFVGIQIGLLARHLGYDAEELMALAEEMGVRYHVRSVGSVPVISQSERVLRAVREDGPMTEMELACQLGLSYLQVRAAAMTLIRKGAARWLRCKLVPSCP